MREAALAVRLGGRLSDLIRPPMSCLALDGLGANDPPWDVLRNLAFVVIKYMDQFMVP